MAIGDYKRVNFVSRKTKASADTFNPMDAKIKELDSTMSSLASGGNNTAHYHSADRDRANHNGNQTASTISDFASTVRNTTLTGLSTALSTVVSASDSIIVALGKLQAQMSLKMSSTDDSKNNTVTFTEASSLENINTTESHATMFGKIKKMFSFIGTNSLTTTAQTISGAINEIVALFTTVVGVPESVQSTITTITVHTVLRNVKTVEYILGATTISTTWVSGTAYTICTLPTGFRPKVELKKDIEFADASSIYGILKITTAGVVTLTPRATATSKLISINETFLAP